MRGVAMAEGVRRNFLAEVDLFRDLMNLLDGQDFRQRLDVFDLHLSQRLPVASARASAEKLHAGKRDSQRSAGERFVILQMQKEFSQLIFRDQIGRTFAEVREVPYCSQIAFVSPFRHAAEVQIFAHAFIKRSIEMRRVRESSFSLWSLSRRLNLSVPRRTPTVR